MSPQISKETHEWLLTVANYLRDAAIEGSPEYVAFILLRLREDLDTITQEIRRESK
jgi:hypothetical protein